MEERTRFFSKFVDWLKSCCKNSAVMLIDNKDWKLKHFQLLDSLSAENLGALVDAWRYVSFSMGDAKKLAESFIRYAGEMQANEDERYNDIQLPDKEAKIDPAYWLSQANQHKCGMAIKKDQVSYKPIVLIDIDLKDQEQALKEGAFISPAADATWLKQLPQEEKVRLLDCIINRDLLITETEPMLILFTGGGYHIWYALEQKTDAGRYSVLHGEICKRVEDLFPGVVVDKAANHITQNIRLPFTFNGKYDPEIPCAILYESQSFTMPNWVRMIHARLEAGTDAGKVKSLTEGTPEDYSPDGALDVSTDSQKAKRLGLRNFRRDPRMWEFIQRYLTFEVICSYTKVPLKNATKHSDPEDPSGYYILCCSPLRKDEHPSFFAFNNGLFCRDKGRQDKEYDYATLMRLLIIKAKERYGLPSTDTTRYEADFHCVYAAYLHYMQRTHSGILPMLDITNAAKKRDGIDTELDPTKTAQKKIMGKQYYLNLQVVLEGLFKQMKKAGSWTDAYLKYVIESTLDTYYFYDVKLAVSNQAYLTNVLTLCIIHYFNNLNLCIQFDRPGRIKLYVVNRELRIHEAWGTWTASHIMTGHKGDVVAKTAIQTFIVSANMADGGKLPQGSPRLCDYVFGVLADLEGMEHDLVKYLPNNTIPDEAGAKNAVVQYLTQEILPGVRIVPSDIKLSVLDTDRYIEFNNGFVLYHTDAEHYDRIGTVIPLDEKNILLQKSVIDLRIEHSYEPGKKTPMFDQFVSDMTYDGNCFDKSMMYFMTSLLYSPRMHPGRVWFLLGRDGDNGKSVIGTVVAGLLGDRYTTSKDLSDLTSTSDRGKNTRFELLHSLLNVTQDSSRNRLEGAFKSLVEGEPVVVRALYEREYDVCLPTHYMVNANSLPATWGETQPLVKRIILTRVDRVVPREKRIDNLGNKIVTQEASGIWPRILKQVPKYLDKGINGFLTPSEITVLNRTFFDDNEVFSFMRDYTFYDPNQDWHVTGKVFKVLFNKYRSYLSKQAVSSDNLISEAASFARKLYGGEIPDPILDKGFDYRCAGYRGLPIRIYVPAQQVGNYSPIDSEKDGTPPPDPSLFREL